MSLTTPELFPEVADGVTRNGYGDCASLLREPDAANPHVRFDGQVQKFGAKMALARAIVQLRCQRRPYELVMDDGTVFFARTIVVATGASYNKPTTVTLDRFAGRGIHYAATYFEAQLCEGQEVIVVGGGNSAGQAAVFLSQTARKV